jgi:hypothetical protein
MIIKFPYIFHTFGIDGKKVVMLVRFVNCISSELKRYTVLDILTVLAISYCSVRLFGTLLKEID